MNVEKIIPELHRHRENLARACGFDVKKLMEHYRRSERGRKSGHRLVSFVETADAMETAFALREEPHKKSK